MDAVPEVPALNLGEISGGKDSSSESATVASEPPPTKEERDATAGEDAEGRPRGRRRPGRQNEIPEADRPRGEASPCRKLPREPLHKPDARKPAPEAAAAARSSPRAGGCGGAPDRPPNSKRDPGRKNEKGSPRTNPLLELKLQNFQLLEALLRFQRAHASEKRRFHEILFGIDKALSSLPVRLEKIRVRNQRNLTAINSSKFVCGDGEEAASGKSSSSEESAAYVSERMKCLLSKMDQLSEIVRGIEHGDASPIETLVDRELHAIALLKKEIKATKRQIEENKTDSETLVSSNDSNRLTEDSSSKGKNSFSNELNKASNFKIFENHMMLQEEALNLLTRKIKETEEALSKEACAREALKRQNDALEKEVARLRSAEEAAKKSRADHETLPSRPYRLIKELRGQLEERERALLYWKSKYSRLEAANANKAILLESEKKKSHALEQNLRTVRNHNKSLASQLGSLQFLNEQLRDQSEILKHQLEILANEKLRRQCNEPKTGEGDANEAHRIPEARLRKLENKLKEMKAAHEAELEDLRSRLRQSQTRSDQFLKTFKEFLNTIHGFGVERDLRSIRTPWSGRIREILQISPSDLQLLFKSYSKNSREQEMRALCEEFQRIVDGGDGEFAEALSGWLFDVISEKLLSPETSDDNNNVNS